MINIIAAVGKNLELGKDNKLIWHIPNDLKYFKENTIGKTIVMGRKTYESMGKALPNRKNIVLTNSNISLNDALVINDYRQILDIKEDVFIIGGTEIFELFLPYANRLYLTEIDCERDADSYFPKFDLSLYKKDVLKTESFNDLKYSFVIYNKIK